MSDVSDDAAGMRMRMGASILCDVAVGHDVTLSIKTLVQYLPVYLNLPRKRQNLHIATQLHAYLAHESR